MEKKPARHTRERIAACALALFNAHGAASVTPVAIALEIGISPGNLHYHFHNKGELVGELLSRYETEIAPLLEAASLSDDVEDLWQFAHRLFDTLARYRFLFRDLNALMADYPAIAPRLRRLIARKEDAARRALAGLSRSGQLVADEDARGMLAVNLTLIGTCWLAYDEARRAAAPNAPERGACQMMLAAAPWLSGEAGARLARLSRDALAGPGQRD
ncbi:TetR/AcrR family transcriptional regulator [Crenobacter caeni]|uniref:TetR family transcriptional regulator n=1 Tax=Crenobacter caeni TaxID=2705474 RepID=A0A6B2KUQ9_9NEIS|nr:TetR/AcrR family transcriptional regulator [Crenobacter caeni]NDV13995.1 TetR family transcriptional regulator [Crenobacter caeni]